MSQRNLLTIILLSVPLLMLEPAVVCAGEHQAKQPEVTLGKKGLKITSPDKVYELSLRGYFQFDGRWFAQDTNNTGRDDILGRRLRPILEAKVDNLTLRFMPDFAGPSTRVFDAYVNYKISDALQLRLGKFKTPIGIEQIQSDADIIFVERGHPSSLAPSRDVGIMAHGDVFPKTLEYQIGIFGGNQDSGNNDSDQDGSRDFVARVFGYPFHNSDMVVLQGLGVGIGGSIGDREGSTANPILGGYKTPGQQSFFRYRSGTFADGQHWRLYPQASWYSGSVGVMAEYALSDVEVTRGASHDSFRHQAWQLVGSYILTGEENNYKGGVVPDHLVDFTKEGIGAWEIAARIGGTEIDDDVFSAFADSAVAARRAVSYGTGIGWYLNDNLKLMANYDITQFDGGASGGQDRPDEHAIFTRAQIRF